MKEKLYLHPCDSYGGGDDDGGWDDTSTTEQENGGSDSDNLPTWQQ